MASKKKAAGQDLAHRVYIPQMLDQTPGQPPDQPMGGAAPTGGADAAALTATPRPGAGGPVLPDAFPPEARAHFDRPVAAIQGAGQQVARVHAALDLAVLDDAQLQLLRNPQTTDACLVGRAQAEAFAGQPEIAAEVGFPTGEVRAQIDRHDSLRNGVSCLGALLRRTDDTRLLVQADRAIARQKVREHIDRTLGTLRPEDPARGRFEAARAHIEAAESKVDGKRSADRSAAASASAEARGRAAAAEAETEVAEVLFELRQGQAPDEARLLKAALLLQQLEAQRRSARR